MAVMLLKMDFNDDVDHFELNNSSRVAFTINVEGFLVAKTITKA